MDVRGEEGKIGRGSVGFDHRSVQLLGSVFGGQGEPSVVFEEACAPILALRRHLLQQHKDQFYSSGKRKQGSGILTARGQKWSCAPAEGSSPGHW